MRLAYALTINKAQGQSLKRVGIWLETPCFAHGQLYVATSRCGNPNDLRFFVNPTVDDPEHPYSTRNVVYDEIFKDNAATLSRRAPPAHHLLLP